MANARARLTEYQRGLICRRVQEEGWKVMRAAVAAGVSRQTAHKWLRRFQAEGGPGLRDRSSRPHRIVRQTRIDHVVAVYQLRDRERLGPHRLSYALGIPRSTVYAVLRRAGRSRLGDLGPKLPALRYEWPNPGDLVHGDTKKLARILPDGGWRNLGRQRSKARRNSHLGPHPGYEYGFVWVDDHSRTPEVTLHADERPASAVASLRALWSSYLRQGIRIKRILTDNGGCYRSRDFAACCRELGIRHLRTRPYTPRTNGKAERFILSLLEGWAYKRLYRSTDERAAALPAFLEEYRHRPNVALNGHTPMCRFASVNNLFGNHN